MVKSAPLLMSALPPLTPTSIINAITGEILDSQNLTENLNQLIEFVRAESERLWSENKSTLEKTLSEISVNQAAEAGKQAGLRMNWEDLPREVKAKSRVERLVRYNTVTSARSYYNSPIITKQEPLFAEYLNLGAVDAQMAKLSRDGNELTLHFKCWEEEFILTFAIPTYALRRDIRKITLPTIKAWGEEHGFVFVI